MAERFDDMMSGDYGGAFERAAERKRLPYKVPRERRDSRLGEFAEMLVPQTPLDVAMMTLGGPWSRAAKTGAMSLGALLTSDEAQAGPLSKLLKGIRAYHGSPHDFEKFDISKIGTGEGHQAYGYGLYFAENPKVSRSYRVFNDTPAQQAVDWLAKFDGNKERAIEMARKNAETARREGSMTNQSESGREMWSNIAKRHDDMADRIETGRGIGRMYEVNIRADPAKMIDWDAPLSKQPEAIRELYAWRGKDPRDPYTGRPVTGKDITPRKEKEIGVYRDLDVPGVRYLDQFSRRKGEGTSNYVIFDDSLIDILRKYGWAGLAALPLARGGEDATSQ